MMAKRKGFTLVEVIISFVIISICATMVLITLGGMNTQLSKERIRTENAFGEQGKLEKEIEKVELLVQDKLKQQDIINDPATTPVNLAEAQSKLASIKIELEKYESGTDYINGQNIVYYRVKVPRYNTQGEHISNLTSWVVESKGLFFPMPEIKNLTTNVRNQVIEPYGVKKIGKEMVSKVEYGKNKELLFKEQYTWYVSRPGFHMVMPKGEKWKPEETHIGSVYPAQGKDFRFVTLPGGSTPSEKNKNLSRIREDMIGSFIACGLRPTIKEGKIGNETFSNLYYIADYPRSVNNILGAVDASLIYDIPDNKKKTSVPGIENKLWLYGEANRDIPEIEPHGEKTGEIIVKDGHANFKADTYSRFFRFTDNSSYLVKGGSTSIPSKYTVFVVAKSYTQSGTLLSGFGRLKYAVGSTYGYFNLGFEKFAMGMPSIGESEFNLVNDIGGYDTKWHVFALSITNEGINIYRDNNYKKELKEFDFRALDNVIVLGYSIDKKPSANMNVAEVIVSKNTDDDFVKAMQKHLTQKYGIA